MSVFLEPAGAGEEVVLRQLLISLGTLLMLLVVIGIVGGIYGFVKAILWPINWVVRHATLGFLHGVPGEHAVTQAMSNALWFYVAAYDAQAGKFWHGTKTLALHMKDGILGASLLAGYLAWFIYHKLNPDVIRHGINRATHAASHAATVAHGAERRAHAATKAAERAAHNTKTIATSTTTTIVRPVEHTITNRVKVIEHTTTGVLAPELAGLRDRAKALEDSAVRAYHQVHGLWKVVSVGAVAAVGLVALTRLGLGWTRCSNVRRTGRALCGLSPSRLNGLLGLFVDFLIVENICTVLPLMEEAFSFVAAPIIETLTPVLAGTCSIATTPPAALTGPAFIPPAVTGTTLYV